MVSFNGSLQRLRSHPQFSFFQPAFIVDWISIFLIRQLATYLGSFEPFHRPVEHQLNDPAITFPHALVERVPNSLLYELAYWLPLGVMLIVSLVLKQNLHDAHHSVLGFQLSRSMMRLVVDFSKNRIGRLRPDFLARCAWSQVSRACTGDQALIRDGRRSFPSGHSATSWQGLLFLSLYLAGKTGAFSFASFEVGSWQKSRVPRLALSVAPLIIAGWVCITRLEDHYHHPEDVIAGTFIGIITAFPIYLVYFRSPFATTSASLRAIGTPKAVYLNLSEFGGELRLEEGLQD